MIINKTLSVRKGFDFSVGVCYNNSGSSSFIEDLAVSLEIRRVALMYLTLEDYILLTELLLKVIEIQIMCYWFFRNKKKK